MYRFDIAARVSQVAKEVGAIMSKRSGVLEFAVLGTLHDQPMHGYELRKRLNSILGSFRAISYGSLYPCLKDLVRRGLIIEAGRADASAPALSGRRARITYELTANGKEHFQDLVAEAGPEAWDDDQFGVHFAFFGRTDHDVRMRILEGRRTRLQERVSTLRTTLSRTSERLDDYTLELARHGLAGVEHEMRWLSELIAQEQINAHEAPSEHSGARQPALTHLERNYK